MINYNKENPPVSEKKGEQTLVGRFGSVISLLLSAFKISPKADKKPESKGEMPKKGK
jgi:hypothetical protein